MKLENMNPMVRERRKEFLKLRYHGIEERLGRLCVNCGTGENVEYHHIVPLILGGTNNISNIVPLCHKCHIAAHRGRHICQVADHSKSSDGRPPKCNDDIAFSALDLLASGQIGVRKCKMLMNLKERTQPQGTSQYKKWLRQRGIKNVRNYLDASIANSCEAFFNCEINQKVIGFVEYENGTRMTLFFDDTGMNDDVQYVVRNSDKNRNTFTYRELKQIYTQTAS